MCVNVFVCFGVCVMHLNMNCDAVGYVLQHMKFGLVTFSEF